MNISASTQWSFRPAQMPEEMFLKTFVGRDEELNMIFSHINFNLIPSTLDGNKKNILIKSERGIGKTSIFLAVKYKLKAERAHMLNKIIPVFFNEQEDFNTAEKLILRTLEIICSDTAVFKSLAHPGEWKKSYSKIKANIQECFDILDNNLTKEEKKLVLFLENFDSTVFRILRKKGSKKKGRFSTQEIFSKLVRDPKILLVCSGLDTPGTHHDYGEETFEVFQLKPVDDFYELILKRARYDNNLFLLANKEKLKNKIKAFEYLTGGNTRLMVHLYECMVEKDINKLELMLNDMINKSTPLFEWIIEKFVDFESREILNALAKRNGNATIKEIADDTFNSQNSVRTLLNRLRKKQFVEKINEKRDKSDIYIMAPMIFFIWYQKSVLQTKDVILDFFIHFVDLFFDPTELADKQRIEQVYRLKEEDKGDVFAPYFSYVKKYIEAGKFPLKSTDEKRQEDLSGMGSENEKMIYELVRARRDDTVLQTQVHRAFSLKAEKKLVESANLFRIVARGYVILTEAVEELYYDRAEENIRRAIEIYRGLKTEPLETVRCILVLVEILSDTKRKEELKLFAQTIIRIGEKAGGDAFNSYLGHAYKYLGFVETETETRLELFNKALGYVDKDISQTVIVLLNIGLTYKKENKYETALEHFEKAFELSKAQNHLDQLNSIIYSITDVYREVEDYRGGLNRTDEILKWLEKEQYDGIDIYEYIGFFHFKTAEYLEAENYLIKGIELAEKKSDNYAKARLLINLGILYNDIYKTEKERSILAEIENIVSHLPDSDTDLLQNMAQMFLVAGYYNVAITVYEKFNQKIMNKMTGEEQVAILSNMAFCHNQSNDFQNAEKYIKKAIKFSKKNNLNNFLASSTLNYSALLRASKRIDEAIVLLENLDRQEPAPDKNWSLEVKEGLFRCYMEKSRKVYDNKDFENALTYTRKGMKYIPHVSAEDFIDGFYSHLLLGLVEQYKRKIYPFCKEIETYLSDYYEDKDKGSFIILFKPVVELVEGKDFDKIAKDMSPFERSFLSLFKEKLDKDEVLEEVEQSIKNKEFDKAADLLEKSLNDNEKDIKKLKKLVEVYEANSQREKYVETLKNILNFYPDDEDTLFNLAAIEEENKNYKEAIEYLNKLIKHSPTGTLKEISKILLAQFYLMDPDYPLPEVEKLLQSIKLDKLTDLTFTYFFYNADIILSMLNQNRERLKHTLTSLLYLIKDSAVGAIEGFGESDLEEILKRKFNRNDYDCIVNLERMTMNEIPFSVFTRKFAGSIDPKMVKDIESEIEDAGDKIFKRIVKESIANIDDIAALCGTRINLESLLYIIKKEFSNLNKTQKNHMVSVLTGIMEKLRESYKWLVLDFCSEHLINLSPGRQRPLVNSLLGCLKEKKESDSFLKETNAFLHTAKNLVDEEALKEKIEKELIIIKSEVEK